jgi:hypothetical protein
MYLTEFGGYQDILGTLSGALLNAPDVASAAQLVDCTIAQQSHLKLSTHQIFLYGYHIYSAWALSCKLCVFIRYYIDRCSYNHQSSTFCWIPSTYESIFPSMSPRSALPRRLGPCLATVAMYRVLQSLRRRKSRRAYRRYVLQ